jgi:hypothetical protein
MDGRGDGEEEVVFGKRKDWGLLFERMGVCCSGE